MEAKPESDRTSVTISKRVHRVFKVRAAELGVTQRSLLEFIIRRWLREEETLPVVPHEKED